MDKLVQIESTSRQVTDEEEISRLRELQNTANTNFTITVSKIIDNYSSWEEGPLCPGAEIECPDCKVFYPSEKWVSYDTYCDTCGGHSALMCANADDRHFFDPYGYSSDVELRIRKQREQEKAEDASE